MKNTSVESERNASGLAGCSEWVRRIQDEIARCAPYEAGVLITGPTGTGKELIARAIHLQSPRAAQPFIPVDCTTLTAALFASQLFGHRKGAFTGADYETLGCFRAAQGGTIFLDEIGDLKLDLQAKLLRVLQERTVVPVGGHEGRPIDVRIVAATNRDLKRDVVQRRSREDLYFRLNVVSLEAIGLCDRRDDIPALCEHFLDQLGKRSGFPRKSLSSGAMELLTLFEWPGNVRQLQHVIEQAAIICQEDVISLPLVHELIEKARLPERRRKQHASALVEDAGQPIGSTVEGAAFRSAGTCRPDVWKTLNQVENEHIRSTIDRTYYNQTAAADLLGISRYALMRKLKRFKISVTRPESAPLDVPAREA